MIKSYKRGDILFCPFCGKHPAGEPLPVEDFVVPNSDVGEVHEEECYECFGWFSVEVGKDDNFGVYGEIA
jgi:hypothetical protein